MSRSLPSASPPPPGRPLLALGNFCCCGERARARPASAFLSEESTAMGRHLRAVPYALSSPIGKFESYALEAFAIFSGHASCHDSAHNFEAEITCSNLVQLFALNASIWIRTTGNCDCEPYWPHATASTVRQIVAIDGSGRLSVSDISIISTFYTEWCNPRGWFNNARNLVERVSVQNFSLLHARVRSSLSILRTRHDERHR